ncbi:MAG: PqiC family protein [Acidobacteria bacterium]|nr:PqiC family protein [Acidobacteriota bacterium]
MRIRHAIAAAALVVCSCGFFSRPDQQFFTLETIPPAQRSATIGANPVAIGTVELPPGLDRRGIVVRKSDHQLDIRGTHQWSDTLETVVLHTLAHDLAARLPDGEVILPGQSTPAGGVRSIDIIFEELAAGPETIFQLRARWTADGLTRFDEISVPMSSLDSSEVASATSQALAQLADRIVASI